MKLKLLFPLLLLLPQVALAQAPSSPVSIPQADLSSLVQALKSLNSFLSISFQPKPAIPPAPAAPLPPSVNHVSLRPSSSASTDGLSDSIRRVSATLGARIDTILSSPAISSASFSGDTNFDEGTLFVDSTNNRVGVATSSPGAALAVTGDGYVSKSLGLGSLVGTNSVLYIATTTLATGGGFGEDIEMIAAPTSNSSSRFLGQTISVSISGSSNLTGTASIGGSRSYNDILTSYSGTVTSLAGYTSRVENESTSAGIISNAYLFRGEQIRNLGSGSITNAYGLYVPQSTIGSGSVGTFYGAFIDVQSAPTTAYGIYVNSLTSATAYPFFYNGTNKVVVTGTGSVGIGTTSPSQQLTVSTSVGFPGITTGAGTAYICTTLATGVLSTSTSACNPSSLRFKDNVADLDSNLGLAAVRQLRPVSYI